MDLYKNAPDDQDAPAHLFARELQKNNPYLLIHNVLPQLRSQRTIKQPCEIEAMRTAANITRDGIVAMMKASTPGMFEYEYKAEFDRVLTKNGVLESAFPSIISSGKNNFYIHYYSYTGQAQDGDMILNDVGAKYKGVGNDVSRGWPCNGRFSEKQRLLYTCAYNTSKYMFSIIKPGMPMADVDLIARKYNYEQLKQIGLCNSYDDIGTYMWHGGAHHVGFDTHDIVDMTRPVAPGMVFCVDIGIYCEKWGIGFRLEDNCLVTETGCENLTAVVPSSIEDIEDIMRK
ncbi:MAG: M24 family metallopeptidase [Clostridiales bacterium]|nr:M24 family metallopeptidase [Clostridiales bacterium]